MLEQTYQVCFLTDVSQNNRGKLELKDKSSHQQHTVLLNANVNL